MGQQIDFEDIDISEPIDLKLDHEIPELKQPRKDTKVFFWLAIALFVLLLVGVVVAVFNTSDEPAEEQNAVDNTQQIIEEPELVATYPIVDTAQDKCYDASSEMDCVNAGSFSGQDAQYSTNQPSFTDLGDGTIQDEVTGLMWTKEAGEKASYTEAVNGVVGLDTAGHFDWRVPSIKELYSLMDFRGTDPDPTSTSSSGLTPFIDTEFFDFEYGNTNDGSRIIDSQWVTNSVYKDTVMSNQNCFFGVNFADGRIKCYPTQSSQNQGYYARYVRGDVYGENNFVDNQDGTVSDQATKLIWQKSDSQEGMAWQEALGYCQKLNLSEKPWRLPNAKELQSIVDYDRSPESTDSAALDPIFDISEITNEAGDKDWPFFWTSTTHLGARNAAQAVYIAFGRSMGNMPQSGGWIDVHGAGSQRSDPKSGDAGQFSDGRGPQGDAVRIENHVRCVAEI